MRFDSDNKVIIETLTEVEASAFIKFLLSEILRHRRDIEDAQELIMKVVKKVEELE